jgi:hypothetical protein
VVQREAREKGRQSTKIRFALRINNVGKRARIRDKKNTSGKGDIGEKINKNGIAIKRKARAKHNSIIFASAGCVFE